VEKLFKKFVFKDRGLDVILKVGEATFLSFNSYLTTSGDVMVLLKLLGIDENGKWNEITHYWLTIEEIAQFAIHLSNVDWKDRAMKKAQLVKQ
jgi:hypothetical protein